MAALKFANGRAFYRKHALTPFMQLAAQERVAVVMLGDSNQLHGGNGHDDGVPYALAELFPVWGSGPLGCGYYNIQESYVGVGMLNNGGNGGKLGVNTGAPAALDALCPKVSGIPLVYSYCVSSANGYMSASAVGAYNTTIDPLHVTAGYAVQIRFRFGTFESGGPSNAKAAFTSGTLHTYLGGTITWYDGHTTSLASGGTINSVTGTYGYADFVSNPITSISNVISFAPEGTTGPGTDFNGPWQHIYASIENTQTTGFACGTLVAHGGAGAKVYLQDLQAWGVTALTTYLDFTRVSMGAAGPNKAILYVINAGLNDRNDTTSCWSPSGGGTNGAFTGTASGATATGYTANVQGIIDYIHNIYTIKGWDFTKAYFLLLPAHMISDPDDATLRTFRTAARAMADATTNMAVFDGEYSCSYDEMLQSGTYSHYYTIGTDQLHLSATGYHRLARRWVRQLASLEPVYTVPDPGSVLAPVAVATTVGTLNASNLNTALGNGQPDVTAVDIKSGKVLGDLTGTLAGSGGGGLRGRRI